MKIAAAFPLVSLCFSSVLLCQEAVQSPEVHPDKTVTLRLHAPKAAEVTVTGEWNLNKPQPLTKDGNGIWSATVGPIPPNIYNYTFSVDGVTMTDPVNPLVKLRARTSAHGPRARRSGVGFQGRAARLH